MRTRPIAAVAAAAAALATLAVSGPARAGSPTSTPRCGGWMNAGQSPDARARELLGVMSTAQKLSMVHQAYSDLTYFGAAGYIPAIPSLCVPALVLNDAGSGLGDGQVGVTSYPAAISQASSWDPALQERLGRSLGGESRTKGVNVLLAPDVNLARVPMNGRTSEQFGEDPFLSGQTAAAYIQGVQSQHVIATVKHYVANEQETNRAAIDERVSDRVLHELYEAPFAAAVNTGHAGAVMCSYNQVNGAHTCENTKLLRGDLDAQQGFPGFVMSDWGAQHSTVASALAGLDMEMGVIQTPDPLASTVPNTPGNENFYGAPLTAAVATGKVPMSVLDDMVRRILRSMFAVGLFDHPVAAEPGAYATNADTPADQQVALSAAEAGTVLLRNRNGVLPLGPADRTIALIGTDAGPAGAPTVAQAGGSIHVQQPVVISPLQGLTARAAQSGAAVVYNDGTSIPAAVALAKQASVAVVYAGYSEAEGTDQADLGFNQGIGCALACVTTAANSDQLIAAVAAANPRTVVVLNTGGPVLMPWIDRVAGVVESWYPGQEDGAAAAAVLFGDIDPAGKLPVTFPRSMADVPTRSTAQYPGVNGVGQYSEGLLIGYRWYQAKHIQPLFPFGFGLSYTTFSLRGLSVRPAAGGGVAVTAVITNTGKRAGADVVQVYVSDPAVTGEPPEQLEGYQKVGLAPGTSRTVTVTLSPHAFATWDSAHQRWATDPGCYRIGVGDSSDHLPLAATVGIGGATCR